MVYYLRNSGMLIALNIIILIALIVVAILLPIVWVGVAVLLVIDIVALILVAVASKHYELKFYDDKIIERYGVLSTHENQSVLTPILGVSISQSFWGRIFNYGDVHIDKVGKKWDISTSYIKEPQKFKAFLENYITNTDYNKVNMFVSQ